MFRDHGRFAELATSCHNTLFKQRELLSTADKTDMECVPSLVSFVGQTGAGKSTLIKLLIQFNQWSGRVQGFPSPIPGINGRDLPTSEDVHLYADPLTVGSEFPIIYADSEGLDGGEREPLAATLRKTRERRESESFGSDSDQLPSRSYTEREVAWMTSKTKRTRQFAAAQLYPRILFAFSDVVVFVHRNPR
jgi:energy-coupling factor transporter ATP-binding protein EcfA2